MKLFSVFYVYIILQRNALHTIDKSYHVNDFPMQWENVHILIEIRN